MSLAPVAGPAPTAEGPSGLAVRIERLRRIFETRAGDEVHAVEGLDLAIAPGEFVTVVGPSGCGKSTLLSIVAGIDAPTSGQVLIDGRASSGPHPRTSVVFQSDFLLPWRTVVDNILLPIEIKVRDPRAYRAKAEALLEQVGLAGFGGKYPSELSGGMRQRVAICRAVIQEPGLLLMDEPFGALDALTREQMIMDLQALWLRLGNTVLFITHGIEEAVFLGDRVIVMSPRPGRIDLELEIGIERPRQWTDVHGDPRFAAAVRRVRETFEARGVFKTQ